MGFTIHGTQVTQSQQAGSTQSFTNYNTNAGPDGLFSDAQANSTTSPGWSDVQVGWYVWGAGCQNAVITGIASSAGTVTVTGGTFNPSEVYVFKATPYPTNQSLNF